MRLSSFTAILCGIVKVFTTVKGRYQAEITLFQYNNTPPGKCHGCTNVFTDEEQHQGCCDDPTNNNGTCIGDDLCDVYFTYCLRPFGSTGRGCSNYAIVTSSVKNDTSSFSFPQPQENINVLGLPNPLLLPGLTDAYTSEGGVQLYIEIWDDDPPNAKPDELVDILLIDHNESVGEESTTRVHSGTYGFASMKLIITVNCIENFQRSDCSKCVPGFTGPDCQQIDNCVRVNCSGNGQCVDGEDSFNCSCDPGFTGELCQTNIDDCVGVNCSGDDLCVDGIETYSCICSSGYTGKDCEENINDCLFNTCGIRGQCVDGVDSFNCSCDPGFTGELCQTNIDECVEVNCSGNGECLDGVNSFTCKCSPGYTGEVCDIQDDESQDISTFIIITGGVIGGSIITFIIILIVGAVCIVLHHKHKKEAQATETFELQSNVVSLATKSQGLESDHQLQEFVKERREVSTKLTKQPRSNEQFELKRNKAYVASTTSQLPTVDNVTYDYIRVRLCNLAYSNTGTH